MDKFALRTVYLYFRYCNLKCRHCWINPPYADSRGVREDEASLDDIISALEECRGLGMNSIKLTGGEPFTRKDIFSLLGYIKKNAIKLNMETNGVFIRSEEARALKEAGAYMVAVSLDGPDARTHEALRGVEGSFDDALKGIAALKDEGINLQIIMSLWKGNKDRMRETIELAKSIGASSVKINLIQGMCRADRMQELQETLSVKETIDIYNKLDREMQDGPSIRVIFDIPPAFKPVKDMRIENVTSCGIFGILGILGDGAISICGIGSNVDTLVLGRIGKDRIEDIWNGHPVLKEIRESIPSRMSGICGRCMLKFYCLGKCRAEAFYSSGSLSAPLSFCQTAYEEGLFPESRIVEVIKINNQTPRNNNQKITNNQI